MNPNDLAAKVIQAIQGKPEAVKAISDALAGGDADAIRDAIAKHAGIQISDEDAQSISAQVRANPSQAHAYST